MEKNSKMNMNIVEANIKLQDENKWVKNDNKALNRRIDFAKMKLDEELDKFEEAGLGEYVQDVIKVLNGDYFFEDGRKRKNDDI